MLAQLTKLARDAHNVKIGANSKTFWTEVQALKAATDKQEADVKLGLKPDWTSITSRIAELKTLVAGTKLNATIGAELSPATKAGIGATLLALLGLGSGKGSSKGLFGLGAGLPAAGTLLAFGGLGLEHLIMSAIGVIGTTIGASIGLALKGLGSAGVFAVGMGSNALVSSSAIADTSAMYKLLAANDKETFAQAIKSIGLPNDAGTQAEWKNAQALISLNTYWDTATSSARAAASKLYSSFLTVAHTYIPLINAAATSNFKSIDKLLQPLITWLDSASGGVGIFKKLEKQYGAQLPTSMSAFTNAIEGLFKTIAYVAPKTGGFIKSLNTFFTSLNTQMSQKGSTDQKRIDNWLTDLHDVGQFFKAFYDTIRDLFHDDKAHTGQAIITTLTSFLKELDAFEKSASGGQKIGTLFEVHKKEIIAILDMIPPIAKALATVYGTIAPGLVQAVTTVIKGITDAIVYLSKIKVGNINFGAWGVGLGLIALKLTGLGSAITSLVGSLTKKGAEAALHGLGSLLGDTKAGNWLSNLFKGSGTTTFTAARFVGAVFEGVAGGGAGALGGTAVSEEESIGKGIASKIASALSIALAGAAALAIGYAIGNAINEKLGLSKKIASALSGKAPSSTQSDLSTLLTDLVGKQTAGTLSTEVALGKAIANLDLKGMTQKQFNSMMAGLSKPQQQLVEAVMSVFGVHMAHGVLSGVTAATPKGTAAMMKFIQTLISDAGLAEEAQKGGGKVVKGFAEGITAGTKTATTSVDSLNKALLKQLSSALPKFASAGAQARAAYLSGVAGPSTGGHSGTSATSGGGAITVSPVYHITITAPSSSANDIAKTVQKAIENSQAQLVASIHAGAGRATYRKAEHEVA